MLTLEDLAVSHPYYCSDNNYTDIDAHEKFQTFDDFLLDWGDMDSDYIDVNLCFRWDIKLRGLGGHDKCYMMNIYFIQQGRGHFKPITILWVMDSDVEKNISFLEPHLNKLKQIWKPFTL